MRRRTASEIGRASRQKGKAGEREAARELMGRMPGIEIKRSVQYSGRGASGSSDGGMPDLIGLPGVHLEIKRTERSEPYKWLEQVRADKRPGEIGVILHRQSRKGWIAIMNLDDFCKLYSKNSNR